MLVLVVSSRFCRMACGASKRLAALAASVLGRKSGHPDAQGGNFGVTIFSASGELWARLGVGTGRFP